jgi:hypothetical protein
MGSPAVNSAWPAVDYEDWSATCDTLHMHTQVLGKLAVELAPPEPQLQHAALRVTPRGWETPELPAPNGSGTVIVALDLRSHEAIVEHADGRSTRVPLTPDRSVGAVTRDVLTAVAELAGPVEINPKPQEVPWEIPLDEDDEHATYDPEAVAAYFRAATQVALVEREFRAPFRGRASPVNAWWGAFDIAIQLYSGKPAEPPADDFISRNGGDAELIEITWWPGDWRYPSAAFAGYAHPAPEGFAGADLQPAAARWDEDLGEYLLDWDDIRSEPDPHGLALEFCHSLFRHACTVCGWDPSLALSVDGVPPPVT